MVDLKRIRAKFSRSNSAAPSLAPSISSDGGQANNGGGAHQTPPTSSRGSHNKPGSSAGGGPVASETNGLAAHVNGGCKSAAATDSSGAQELLTSHHELHDGRRQEEEEEEVENHDGRRRRRQQSRDTMSLDGSAKAATDAGAAAAAAAPAPASHSTGLAPEQASGSSAGKDRQPPQATTLASINEQSSPSPPTTTTINDPATTAAAAPVNDNISTSGAAAASRANPANPAAAAAAVLSDSASPTLPRSASLKLALVRRQSLLANRQSTLIRTLLASGNGGQADELDAAGGTDQLLPHITANMVMRKVWVKRPGGSATMVTITEDDMVDDVRDLIMRKYANSLGRHFDSPDLTLRIVPREQRVERTLGPDESMGRILDAYFPGGQAVDEALIIDVPLRRTPRASPRTGPPHAPHITSALLLEDMRPPESGTDYFGPSAMATAVPVTVTAPSTSSSQQQQQHAISVLATGQVPQIPSPGGTRSRQYRDRPERPRLGRQHTSSPTILHAVAGNAAATVAAVNSLDKAVARPSSPAPSAGSNSGQMTKAQALSTPPVPEASSTSQRVSTPPAVPVRASSPRPTAAVSVPRLKKQKKAVDHPSLPIGSLATTVPPINVLIVEDNIINLKLLEAFVKRLKVRWQTAMNGRDAVTRWRQGGFHLVLMDIQLPVMNGLDATREIRRLERINSIGVFSSSASSAPEETKGDPTEPDKLPNIEMFKSPVIIVALTASSLQSDRHEALAAGCNDFLTKPVNFVWLERKVMEWGCMQALIDFDGWRKWKEFKQNPTGNADTASGGGGGGGGGGEGGGGGGGGSGAATSTTTASATKKAATKAKKTKNRQSLTNAPPAVSTTVS